ncbi:hypothetical protein [Rhodococcus sp. LB1]|uniref:hypothetical protein n=1 Tax=Rhodococcus sp. LB1 TaxID=1807499 RepID=UPI00077A8127|nr:hypothetical protein [Rhodococcus sp. LB1]KXX59709.1 hypothetical protein AZG88_06735 [Rhodococcus sp. LB1]
MDNEHFHPDGIAALMRALSGTPLPDDDNNPTPAEIAKGRGQYEIYNRNRTSEHWGSRWNFERAVERFNRPPAPEPPIEPRNHHHNPRTGYTE